MDTQPMAKIKREGPGISTIRPWGDRKGVVRATRDARKLYHKYSCRGSAPLRQDLKGDRGMGDHHLLTASRSKKKQKAEIAARCPAERKKNYKQDCSLLTKKVQLPRTKGNYG